MKRWKIIGMALALAVCGRYVFTFKMIDDTRRMEGERQTRPEVPQGVELR